MRPPNRHRCCAVSWTNAEKKSREMVKQTLGLEGERTRDEAFWKHMEYVSRHYASMQCHLDPEKTKLRNGAKVSVQYKRDPGKAESEEARKTWRSCIRSRREYSGAGLEPPRRTT